MNERLSDVYDNQIGKICRRRNNDPSKIFSFNISLILRSLPHNLRCSKVVVRQMLAADRSDYVPVTVAAVVTIKNKYKKR